MEQIERKEKKKSALWRRLALAALGSLLGLSAYQANARGLMGNQLPMPFGFGAAVVLSGSMEPALGVNDLILVREAERYELGDIVVYQRGSILVVHRVLALDGETLVTQGDANNGPDAPIALRDVKGKVIARVPGFGQVVEALRSPAGIVTLLLAAFALTELSFRREKDAGDKELAALKEELRRLREERTEQK